MRITPINSVKNILKIITLTSAVALSAKSGIAKAQSTYGDSIPDTFVQTSVPPEGTQSRVVLFNAPNPYLSVKGEMKSAKFIVDLSQNILYAYDESGNATSAYLVASGKKTTPSTPGVKVVSHVESYPYKTAPRRTKRYRNPSAYGPRCIILENLNTKTGEKSPTGEFVHGNNNPASLGNYASQGCIRMDNQVIKMLAKEVKCGDIVIFQE